MKYKQGEIYLVKFHPSLGKELRKFRPAIIMFDNQHSDFITLAPLTSILKVRLPKLEFVIKPDKLNGLDSESLILGWYLRTVDTTMIQKYLGKLDKSDLIKLKKTLSCMIS